MGSQFENEVPNDGGRAFARPFSGKTQYAQEGLSQRAYFASHAMQGILAGSEVSAEFAAICLGIDIAEYNPIVHWPQYIAKRAVAMSDALIKELNDGVLR